MNTKLLMILSALFTGFIGLIFTFLPQESASYIGWAGTNLIVLQIMGALYFGFALINWMTKSYLIGGIYSRPVTIGNFTHFLIGAIALIKTVLRNPAGITILTAAIIYSVFAIFFAYVLFKHPLLKTN